MTRSTFRRSRLLAAGVAAAVTLSACAVGGSSGGSSNGAGGNANEPCSQLVFGGPAEFQTRPDGIPGIAKTYNCTFKEFRPLDTGGPLTVKALEDGTIQAADLFTTDPTIADKGFVVLEDPKNNFAAQNVVPLINKDKATPAVTAALNAVSGKLSTDQLVDLNRKLGAADKPDVGTVAKAWLAANPIPAGAGGGGGAAVKIGSANFPENRVLAEIYAEAIESAGGTVERKFGIGSRETYFPGLKDGSIDLVPEYTGVLLQYLDKTASQTSADDVFTALQSKVPAPLTVLDKAAAEDKDAIAVTAATAQKYGKSLADYSKK